MNQGATRAALCFTIISVLITGCAGGSRSKKPSELASTRANKKANSAEVKAGRTVEPAPTKAPQPTGTPPAASSPAPVGKGQTVKIMPLGGSIPFGWPDVSYGGYRNLLGTLLTKDGYHVEFVGSQRSGVGVIPYPENEGHPGWTISQTKDGIDSKGWLEMYQPDIILLYIGSNDLSQGQAASAPANLSGLLDDILKRVPHAHVIVAQLIPVQSGMDPARQAYNAAIPGMVASKGPQVTVIAMQTVLSSADYAPDGMHPNSSGYDKMARAYEPAILAILAAAN